MNCNANANFISAFQINRAISNSFAYFSILKLAQVMLKLLMNQVFSLIRLYKPQLVADKFFSPSIHKKNTENLFSNIIKLQQVK